MALIVMTTLSSSSTTRTLGCSRIARRSLDRQRDHEGRPAANAAAHAHRSAVTLNDSLRPPEPEAGALSGFRGEERLADLGEEVVRNSLTGAPPLDPPGIAPQQ